MIGSDDEWPPATPVPTVRVAPGATGSGRAAPSRPWRDPRPPSPIRPPRLRSRNPSYRPAAGRHQRATLAVMADHQMDQEVALKRGTPVGPLRKPRAYQPRGQILVPSSPGPAGPQTHRLPAVPRRVRLREKWTGFAPWVQPPLKARVGLADIVQRRGALDHVQQVFGEADPLRQRPRPCPDSVTMPVQLHGDLTQRQFVELIAQGIRRWAARRAGAGLRHEVRRHAAAAGRQTRSTPSPSHPGGTRRVS